MDVVDQLEKMKQGKEETQLQQQKQKQHFHVLAVDDSLIDRKLLEKLLTVSSYHVTCVESGDKALQYLGLLDGPENDTATTTTTIPSSSSSSTSSSSSANSSQREMQIKVNLIMTDYCMPGMSGYDLLKRVKGSSWKDVPVVVMSSENVPSRINMCLEEGAEDFLLKPVQLSDLKKLQPHLLKSLSSSSNEDEDEGEENIINENNSSCCSSSGGSKSFIINNGVCKRKALVSADPSERRSKLKD